ncbi:glycosyltransferase family 2 protein [Priestia aryabhattai]|uniref:glycosyltransferase family 2 protein n=1 Tax=Priestia aryabhattai TaxID=412384 RepID=UPI001CCFA620|nr:glycosyltransferase family A protein [Priestia aryabhattai]MBZ6484011.1 glycosyltransferase family 2 protein [Priestia aryabhattai]
MKDIHVLCINYNIRSDLRKALSSLNYILPRLNKVTVFDSQYPHTFSPDLKLPFDIDYINSRQDLGITLNNYIQTIENEYVLFLFTNDLLVDKIKGIPLTLEDDKPIMTVYYENKDAHYKLPFIVKTSFLKKSPFLLEREVPFRELIFHSWIIDKDESNIVASKGNVIERIRETPNITAKEKLEFAHKLKGNSYKNVPFIPTLSVMISNFNMEKFLSVAIQSCIKQTIPFDQIIVVDDGSTDNSLKFLERYKTHPNIQCFSKSNEGKAKALNYLLPFLTSEFVLELDADDWLDPDAVLLIKKYLINIPQNVSLLYGNFRYWTQNSSGDIGFSKIRKGKIIRNRKELLSYKFPLGPRIYRTSSLIKEKGFPIIDFKEGRLYEDVTILVHLFKKYEFCYEDFTIYNVRKHDGSITKKNHSDWNDFRKLLN